MPPVVRMGSDPTVGHCYPPMTATSGSNNVLTNGIPTVKVGDSYPVHCCGTACHGANQGSGSGSVIVNGSPVARIGDALTCGDSNGAGCGNVIAG